MSNNDSTTHIAFTTCLWCNADAEEKANYYCSVFKDSRITNSIPGVTTSFELRGNKFMALNGGVDFEYNNSISLVIDCKDQEEVDYYWNRFIGDGGEAMDCSWCKDKYGLRWQIVPTKLTELMLDKDPNKAQKVMQAMLKMQKIIIKDLEEAYNQA
jgi:predicted 3-demethylubiquinone-9 3-methyltransferase (glyoxalase superfamily)